MDDENTCNMNNSFQNPGSAYLTFLKYFSEEKELSETNNFSNWEIFVHKYFEPNIEMTFKVMEGEKLFMETSKKK